MQVFENEVPRRIFGLRKNGVSGQLTMLVRTVGDFFNICGMHATFCYGTMKGKCYLWS
jgi:hypothetical protein